MHGSWKFETLKGSHRKVGWDSPLERYGKDGREYVVGVMRGSHRGRNVLWKTSTVRLPWINFLYMALFVFGYWVCKKCQAYLFCGISRENDELWKRREIFWGIVFCKRMWEMQYIFNWLSNLKFRSKNFWNISSISHNFLNRRKSSSWRVESIIFI